MKLKTTLALTLAVSVPMVANAMTIRHDVSDTLYRNLGNSFTGVGSVVAGGAFGSGTLIAPNWVVTAAHVVGSNTSATFTVGGNTYNSVGVFARSGWTLSNGRDIALIQLNTNVVGVSTYALNYGTDELGMVGTTVGFGQTGNGNTGINAGAGTKRGGRNVIDDATTGNLVYDFDSGLAGDNNLGSSTPQDLEHNVAPGDSGGALFINRGGQFQLAGVTSWFASNDGNTNADYGDFSGFTRIAGNGNTDWIEQTSGVPEPSTLALAGLGALAFFRRKKKASK